MKTLYKYVSKEFVLPFFVGLVGFIVFVSVEMLYQLSDVIVQNHVGFWSLLVLMYYNLPQFIVMGIPVGVLLAIFWMISNFSSHRELMALQVHGVNLKKIVLPFLVVALCLSVVTYMIEDFVIPSYNYKATEYLQRTVFNSKSPQIKTNTFFKADNSYFYVKKFDPSTERFDDVLMYKISGNDISVTYAKSAYLEKGKWYLKDGRIYTLKNGIMTFDMSFQTMKLDITEDIIRFIRSQKSPNSMSSRELMNRIKLFRKLGLDPRIFIVELNSRFANALGALIIAFLGVPFSLFFGIKSKSWGVIVTFLLVVLYQGSGAWLSALGKNGTLSPEIAAWTPDLVFAGLGLTFFLLLDSRLMFKIKEFVIRIMPIMIITFILISSGRVFGSQMFNITAGQLDMLSATEVVYSGGVTVKSFNYTVSASSLKVLFNENRYATLGIFTGNVVYIQGKRKILSSKITIEFQKQMAIIDNINGIVKVKNAKGVKKDVYFRGLKSTYSIKSGTSVIEPGYITTCKFNPPHYKVEASKIFLVPDDHLVAYNLVMYIFGVPVLYLPQYYYSLTGGKQPMEVSFNHSTTQGWYSAVKFNFSPSDSLNGDAYFTSYEKGPSTQGFDFSGKLFTTLPYTFSYYRSLEKDNLLSEIVKFGLSQTFFKKYKTSFNYQNDVKFNHQNSEFSLNGPAIGGSLSMKVIQDVSNGTQIYDVPYSIKGFNAFLGNVKVTGKLDGRGHFSIPFANFSSVDSIFGNFSWPIRFFTLKSITGTYSGGLSLASNQPLGYSTFADASYGFDPIVYKLLGMDLNLSYGAKTGFKLESKSVSISNRIAAIVKTKLSYNLMGIKLSALHTFVQVGGKSVSNFDTHNYQNNVAFSANYNFPIIPLNALAKFSYNFNNQVNPLSNTTLTTSSNFKVFGISNSLNTSTIISPSPKLINTKYTLDSKWNGLSYHAETLYDYNSKSFSDISNKFIASVKRLLFLYGFKLSTQFTLKPQNLSIENLNFEASANLKDFGIGISSKGNISNGQLQSMNLNFSKNLDCLGLRGTVDLSTIGGFKISKFSLTLYITAFPEKYVSVDPVTGNFGFSLF